jgi:phosphatidylglycerophosphatase C
MNALETNTLVEGTVRRLTVLPGVAIFDFDRTFIHSGSLAPVLAELVGRPRLCAAYARAGLKAAFAPSRLRAEVFRNAVVGLIAGKTEADLLVAAERAYRGLRWRDEMLAAYLRHREAGHRVVVASGGLACCVRRLLDLKGIAVDGVLATEIEAVDGVFTGRIAGNACVGLEKARRAQAWLAGPNVEVWGYGNLPADRAMLALTQFPTVVSAFGVRTPR